MTDEIIGVRKLENDFVSSGVGKDDIIMLHSSLKSIGWVEGGANMVIDALLNVIGKDGTLVVPTYTYSYCGKEGATAFDKKSTTSVNNGIIADTLWRRSEAQRSDHPAYSFGAIGKHAKHLISNHPLNAPLGIGSPLHRLSEMCGKILLLGVGQDRNSLIHVAEAVAGAKYQCLPFRESWGRVAKRLNDRSEEEFIDQSEFPGCSYNFGVIEDSLIAKGLVKFGKVGNATTRLMVANDVIRQVKQILSEAPGFLLCNRPECECCTNRRRLLEKLK